MSYKKRRRGSTDEQIGLLLNTWLDCDEQDKSTEYMLQFMQDVTGLSLEAVLAFIEESPDGHVSKAVYWGDKLGVHVPNELRIAARQEQRELRQLEKEARTS